MAPRAGEVESFVEKPSGDRLEVLAHASKHATQEFPFEASMGIYVFKRAPPGPPASPSSLPVCLVNSFLQALSAVCLRTPYWRFPSRRAWARHL